MQHVVSFLLTLNVALAQAPDTGAHERWLFNPKGYQVPLVYRQELESNLLWMIARGQRRTVSHEKVEPVVGIYADSGVWHLGAKSIVFALEREGIPVRVLDHAAMTQRDFNGLKAIIVPGGYASFCQAATLNDPLQPSTQTRPSRRQTLLAGLTRS